MTVVLDRLLPLEFNGSHLFRMVVKVGECPVDVSNVDVVTASDFEMVTPEGARIGYTDVIEGIRDDYASHEPGTFEIEIRNVEVRCDVGYHSLVRYEEWQVTAEGTTGRLSSVLFEDDSDALGNVRWLDVHETWLAGPD